MIAFVPTPELNPERDGRRARVIRLRDKANSLLFLLRNFEPLPLPNGSDSTNPLAHKANTQSLRVSGWQAGQ